MRVYFGARLSLAIAIFLLIFGAQLRPYNQNPDPFAPFDFNDVPDLIVSTLLVLAVAALIYRFWRLELSLGVSSNVREAHAATQPDENPSVGPLLSTLRTRAFFVSAGTFFATSFLFIWAPAFLGFPSIENTIYFWNLPHLKTLGLEFPYDSARALFVPATILIVIVFPLLAIACILMAASMGSSGGHVEVPKAVLLRPFGERKMTKALKRVVGRHLGRVAFVYTLSDKHYRPNPLLGLVTMVWGLSEYVLGPIFRPSIRYVNVRSAELVGWLRETMTRRWSPSWRTALSAHQALNIRSTDEHWKDVIDVLLETTDFAVMDISKVGEGSAWEIERLFALDLAHRCIFIVQQGHGDGARASLVKGASGREVPSLHEFRWNGLFTDEPVFQLELVRQMQASLQSTSSSSGVGGLTKATV